MDAVNTIKITVESTKTETVAKPEKPIVIGNSEDITIKEKNKETFSDKLKGEIDNSAQSQKNVASESEMDKENNDSGNLLPEEELPSSVAINKLVGEEGLLLDIDTAVLNADAVAVDLSTTKALLTSDLSQPEKKDLLNSIDHLFKQINSLKNTTSEITAVTNADILKSIMMPKNMTGESSVISNALNKTKTSLFTGSSAQNSTLTGQLPGGINLSFELSSGFGSTHSGSDNQASNSFLNQQIPELQMKLLGQDKLLDTSFDISKLTQAVAETQKSLASSETTILNQLRNLSEFSIKTPILDKQWHTDFSNNVAFMAKSGGGNALITLNPAHLGPIEASIRVVNEVVTIQVAATHVTTRDALDAAIPKLKEMLEEQGFSKVNVDISDKNASHNFSKKSEGSSEGTSSASSHSAGENEGDILDNGVIELSKQSKVNGVVDYFA